MRRLSVLRSVVALAAAACGTAIGPDGIPASGNLRIDQVSTQRIAEVEGVQVRAVVTNTSGTDYFAMAGDAFNGALDQERIFAALGTHAVIERLTNGQWEPANTAILVEGTKYVVLKAGKSYVMDGSIAGRNGVYRVRVDYTTVNGDPSNPLPMRDYSAQFVVF